MGQGRWRGPTQTGSGEVGQRPPCLATAVSTPPLNVQNDMLLRWEPPLMFWGTGEAGSLHQGRGLRARVRQLMGSEDLEPRSLVGRSREGEMRDPHTKAETQVLKGWGAPHGS